MVVPFRLPPEDQGAYKASTYTPYGPKNPWGPGSFWQTSPDTYVRPPAPGYPTPATAGRVYNQQQYGNPNPPFPSFNPTPVGDMMRPGARMDLLGLNKGLAAAAAAAAQSRNYANQQLGTGITKYNKEERQTKLEYNDLLADIGGWSSGMRPKEVAKIGKKYDLARQELRDQTANQIAQANAQYGRDQAQYYSGLGAYENYNAQYAGQHGPLVYGQADPYYYSETQSAFSAVKKAFPGVTNLGDFVVKNVRGTSSPSDHAYGAAIDIGIPSIAVGKQIAYWLQARMKQFGITKILFDPLGWHGRNVGDHNNHIHLSFI